MLYFKLKESVISVFMVSLGYWCNISAYSIPLSSINSKLFSSFPLNPDNVDAPIFILNTYFLIAVSSYPKSKESRIMSASSIPFLILISPFLLVVAVRRYSPPI